MILQNKNIILGITGGIAAYKSITVLRLLKKEGANVQVITTPDAEQFVTKTTLAALSGLPVLSTLTDKDGNWNNHVDLALWADLICVAPCTAQTLAKFSYGFCDNLLTAIYLSARSPVMVVPAMDLDMYAHAATQENMNRCSARGNIVLPAASGALASGLEGMGRLPEPEEIAAQIMTFFSSTNTSSLSGKKIVITAGPTYEAIDPVRFIGNHSSGKMGYAIAEEAARRGAEVILISGPSFLVPKHERIQLHRVVSANEMWSKVQEFYPEADVAIASAAVADYAPKHIAEQKIKKAEDTLTLELIKNPDILKWMGDTKTHQVLVGFALETQNGETFALEKLAKKNLDMIVLNTLEDAGAGFKNDTNKVKLLTAHSSVDFPLKTKTEVAADILDFVETHCL